MCVRVFSFFVPFIRAFVHPSFSVCHTFWCVGLLHISVYYVVYCTTRRFRQDHTQRRSRKLGGGVLLFFFCPKYLLSPPAMLMLALICIAERVPPSLILNSSVVEVCLVAHRRAKLGCVWCAVQTIGIVSVTLWCAHSHALFCPVAGILFPGSKYFTNERRTTLLVGVCVGWVCTRRQTLASAKQKSTACTAINPLRNDWLVVPCCALVYRGRTTIDVGFERCV